MREALTSRTRDNGQEVCMAMPELKVEKTGNGNLLMLIAGEWKLENNLPSPLEVENALSAGPEITRADFDTKQIAVQMAQSRRLIIEQTQQTLPMAFLVVLMFWLTILFAGFGLLTPVNTTVIAVLFVCALSVAGAIFLILEMDTPFTGVVKVSSATMQKALEHLGR